MNYLHGGDDDDEIGVVQVFTVGFVDGDDNGVLGVLTINAVLLVLVTIPVTCIYR